MDYQILSKNFRFNINKNIGTVLYIVEGERREINLLGYIFKNILTGNEYWRYDKKTNTYAYFQKNKFNENGLGTLDTMLCTHFRWQQFDFNIKEGMFQGNDKGEIMFNFYDNSKGIEFFKEWLRQNWLNGKPVEVYYALQCPIIIKKDAIYNWNYLYDLYKNPENISIVSNDGLLPIVEKRNHKTISRKK